MTKRLSFLCAGDGLCPPHTSKARTLTALFCFLYRVRPVDMKGMLVFSFHGDLQAEGLTASISLAKLLW